MSRIRLAALLVVCSAGLTVALLAQQPPASLPTGTPAASAVAAVRHDTSPALRNIPPIGVDGAGDRTVHEPRRVPKNVGRKAPFRDPVAQDAPAVPLIAAPTVNFEGVNNLSGVLPPDTNGDVGPNHYVQWINLKFAIWNKTGTLLYGPADGRTLFAGFGGPCETRNDGDPIVLYDEAADRWLMTQFSLPGGGTFYQCIAVSATGDPTGAYHRYAFAFPVLNDYPKFGVWRDGYYMTINQFAAGSYAWRGAGVVAFERDRMLLGQAARMIYKNMYSVDPNLGGMLPSDVDGTLPPAGTPNYVMQFDDNPDQMQVWAFTANWTTGTGTFSKVATLVLPALDSGFSCGGSGRDCIPQPGTTEKLDALSDRLMFRLQYRNFGGHESFVTNHTVDVDGTNHAGVRWYEIRRTSNVFSLHQSGTFAPDAHHRWMASAAMDRNGGIGVAYNVSSTTVYPSVRYTGRLAGSPLGVLDQGEADIIGGSGSQTHTASRWGDYSNVSVDPVDGCTFWATLEYMQSTSSAGWRTRIAAFKLPGCGTTQAPPSKPTLSLGAYSSTSVALSWTDSDSETSYLVGRCTGNSCAPAPIATLGANVLGHIDTTVAASTTYTYNVTATSVAGSTASDPVVVTTPAGTTTINAPTGLTAAARGKNIRLTWVDNASNESRFELERTAGTTATIIAAGGANATSYTDSQVTSGTTYAYRVRACGAGTNCSDWSGSASARAR